MTCFWGIFRPFSSPPFPTAPGNYCTVPYSIRFGQGGIKGEWNRVCACVCVCVCVCVWGGGGGMPSLSPFILSWFGTCSNFNFLIKDQLTKKKDRILIKDLISNK